MKRIYKDPDADLDYSWDWSDWLAAGETITAATVTLPAGLTLGAVVQASGVVTAWISGGTAGTEYQAVCSIVTSSAREDDRTILLTCRQR